MSTILLGHEAIRQDAPDVLLAKGYPELVADAETYASAAGVSETDFYVAMSLLEDVRTLDEPSALNCLRDIPRSMAIASAVRKVVPEAPVNESVILLAAVTSDAGKATYKSDFLQKSSRGEEWTSPDQRWMTGHSVSGPHLVLAAGLPMSVVKVDAEHHSLQIYPRYGMGMYLSEEERVARDILAAADFAGAMMERKNTKNSMMDEATRLTKIVEDLHLLFDDPIYRGRGTEIVEEAMLLLAACRPENIPQVPVPTPPAWKAIGLIVIGAEGDTTYMPQIRALDQGDDMFVLESGQITDVRPAT